MKAFGIGVLAILLLVGITIGGYQLGWWLNENAVNRTTSIANDSLARQQALAEKVSNTRDDITKLDVTISTASPDVVPQLKAQRVALVDDMCQAYGGLTGRITLSPSVISFATEACAR